MFTNRRKAMVLLIAFALPAAALAVSLESESERRSDSLAIRSLLEDWDRALMEGDIEKLRKLLAPEYFGGGATLDEYLNGLKTLGAKYTESARDNVEIRFYGETAFVSGQWTHRGNSRHGSFTSTFAFTDLWVKHDGSWRCVATIPDQARQAYKNIEPVRVGPDVKSDVVIVFGAGASNEEIEKFRQSRLSDERDSPVRIGTYTRAKSIEGHAVVALQLRGEFSKTEHKFFVESLLRDPIVFRVFENIAPDDVTLGE